MSWAWCVGEGNVVSIANDFPTIKLEKGVSAEVEIRRQFGDPVTVTVTPHGTLKLDYPRQPEGWTNDDIQIGPVGKMSSLRQLLHADNLARVTPSLSRDDVHKLLGRPANRVRYDLKNEEVWDWRSKEGGQMSKLFSLTFNAAGKVSISVVGDDPRETMSGSR